MKKLLLIFGLAILLSCSGNKEEDMEKLFQKGQELQTQHKYKEAIKTFERLISKSEKNKYTAQAQFMIAFIYAENIKDYATAEKEFNKFMKEYPDSPLMESAKWEMQNMGKKLEELPIFKDSLSNTDSSATAE